MKPCYNKYRNMSKPVHQVENTIFNNVINKDVNNKFSKDKSSKYQSPSKLINDNTMENIRNNKRKNQQLTKWRQKGIQEEFLWVKGKKRKTRSHWNGIPDHWKCRRSKFDQTMEERYNLYCRWLNVCRNWAKMFAFSPVQQRTGNL